MTDLRDAQWHTSTRSSSQGQCVEVACNLPGVVALRDSKDPSGPALVTAPAAWRAFTDAVKDGGFDR